MTNLLDRAATPPAAPPATPPAAPPASPPSSAPNAAGPAAETRRSTSTIRTVDVLRLLGAAAAALGLTSWLALYVLPIQGELPFVAIAYGLFLLLFTLLTAFDENRPTVRDRVVAVVLHSLAFLLLLALFSVVLYTVGRGLEALGHVTFFTQDMSQAGPLDPLDTGGIVHAIAGTLIMITIALAISIPLGVTTAVFLSEFPGRFSRFVRTVVEAMTALPSIVAGLFIYATVIVALGFNRSGFAASLAITVMMLPIIIRSSDVVLRLVPGTLTEAARALGASRWKTVWTVTLPTARSGLTTAIILGTARGIGETSPVLLTAGSTTFLNLNPFSGAMTSLPLTTFTFVKSPELTMIARGFGTAAVLMALVLVLFAIARAIGGRGPGQLSARQRASRARRSREDDYRFRARELGVDTAAARRGPTAAAAADTGSPARPTIRTRDVLSRMLADARATVARRGTAVASGVRATLARVRSGRRDPGAPAAATLEATPDASPDTERSEESE